MVTYMVPTMQYITIYDSMYLVDNIKHLKYLAKLPIYSLQNKCSRDMS